MLVPYLSCELPSWLQREHTGVSGLLTLESTYSRLPLSIITAITFENIRISREGMALCGNQPNYDVHNVVQYGRKYVMLYTIVLAKRSQKPHATVCLAQIQDQVAYSFGIPAFKLSYLLCGYSKQFSLFSMCFPSYPPNPCTVMLTKLSALEPG